MDMLRWIVQLKIDAAEKQQVPTTISQGKLRLDHNTIMMGEKAKNKIKIKVKDINA